MLCSPLQKEFAHPGATLRVKYTRLFPVSRCPHFAYTWEPLSPELLKAGPPRGYSSLRISPPPRSHPNPCNVPCQHIGHITRFYFLQTTVWYYLFDLLKFLILKIIMAANIHSTAHNGSIFHTRLNPIKVPICKSERSTVSNFIGLNPTYQLVSSSQPPMR